ncbi:hypothetical protein M1413_01645 [Patescibacteria group bacterium]|nr:hypothetical protein [Patescibacteria group bacterium]MCL5114459.1 hypothetical protein [Patescibacteria group bacterium]
MLEELIASSRLPYTDKSVWIEFILPHLTSEQKLMFFEELNFSSYALENYTESFKLKKRLASDDPKAFKNLVKEELEEIAAKQ